MEVSLFTSSRGSIMRSVIRLRCTGGKSGRLSRASRLKAVEDLSSPDKSITSIGGAGCESFLFFRGEVDENEGEQRVHGRDSRVLEVDSGDTRDDVAVDTVTDGEMGGFGIHLEFEDLHGETGFERDLRREDPGE